MQFAYIMCSYSVLLYARETHFEPKKSKKTPFLCSVKHDVRLDTSAKNSYSDGDKVDFPDYPPPPLPHTHFLNSPQNLSSSLENITDEEEIKFSSTKECQSMPSRTKGN